MTDTALAPRQADEGAPEAWLVFDADVSEALRDIRAGDELMLLTWLDRARRDLLVVHPRGDPARPLEGVFSTRSPHRPNPIGLHRVEVTAVDGRRLLVRHLEAVHGTPTASECAPCDAAIVVLDGRRDGSAERVFSSQL